MIRFSSLQRFALLIVPLSLISLHIAGQVAGGNQRIELKPGAPALTIEGDVTHGRSVVYVFHAAAGLKFNGRITKKTGNIGFAVDPPSGGGLPEEEFDFNTTLTGSLPETGDYRIIVATFETHPAHYVLVVRVY